MTNSTIVELDENFDYEVDVFGYITIFVELVLSIPIIGGNSLVIHVVRRYPRLRQPHNYFVVSIAFADLLIGISLTFLAMVNLYPDLMANKYWCIVRYTPGIVSIHASLSGYFSIAVDRHLSITTPLRYTSIITKTRLTCAIVFIWICSCVFGSMPLLGMNTWNDDCIPKCSFETIHSEIYQQFIFCNGLVGFVIIGGLYVHISYIAHRQNRKVVDMIKSMGKIDGQVPNTSTSNQLKITKTMAILFCAFLSCWLPFIICSLLPAFGTYKIIIDYISLFAFFLAGLNSLFNPVFFAWKNQSFNSAFKETLRMKTSVNNNW